mgnify:CR=1 FL=1
MDRPDSLLVPPVPHTLLLRGLSSPKPRCACCMFLAAPVGVAGNAAGRLGAPGPAGTPPTGSAGSEVGACSELLWLPVAQLSVRLNSLPYVAWERSSGRGCSSSSLLGRECSDKVRCRFVTILRSQAQTVTSFVWCVLIG